MEHITLRSSPSEQQWELEPIPQVKPPYKRQPMKPRKVSNAVVDALLACFVIVMIGLIAGMWIRVLG